MYVPGGTASYPSTVLMNCIPSDSSWSKKYLSYNSCLGSLVNPAIIYAAKKCGVKEIYKTGGAHSIAALLMVQKLLKKLIK